MNMESHREIHEPAERVYDDVRATLLNEPAEDLAAALADIAAILWPNGFDSEWGNEWSADTSDEVASIVRGAIANARKGA